MTTTRSAAAGRPFTTDLTDEQRRNYTRLSTSIADAIDDGQSVPCLRLPAFFDLNLTQPRNRAANAQDRASELAVRRQLAELRQGLCERCPVLQQCSRLRRQRRPGLRLPGRQLETRTMMSPRTSPGVNGAGWIGVDEVDKASYAHRPTGRPLPAWPTALLASTSTAMVATGAIPLLTEAGSKAAAATAAVGALVSAGVVTGAVCHERRQEITASAQASVERVAGPVHRFRVRRWRGGLVGIPQLVRFRYQPAAVVANKTWPGAGAAVLAGVLGAKYRVSHHDPRLGRITLRLTATAPIETPSVEIERATTMMQLLFGQTASRPGRQRWCCADQSRRPTRMRGEGNLPHLARAGRTRRDHDARGSAGGRAGTCATTQSSSSCDPRSRT